MQRGYLRRPFSTQELVPEAASFLAPRQYLHMRRRRVSRWTRLTLFLTAMSWWFRQVRISRGFTHHCCQMVTSVRVRLITIREFLRQGPLQPSHRAEIVTQPPYSRLTQCRRPARPFSERLRQWGTIFAAQSLSRRNLADPNASCPSGSRNAPIQYLPQRCPPGNCTSHTRTSLCYRLLRSRIKMRCESLLRLPSSLLRFCI